MASPKNILIETQNGIKSGTPENVVLDQLDEKLIDFGNDRKPNLEKFNAMLKIKQSNERSSGIASV